MKHVTQAIIALTIAISGALRAEQTVEKIVETTQKQGWRLSVGAVRRKSSLELTKLQLGNSSAGVFANGSVEEITPGVLWQYNVDNALAQAAILSEVVYSTISEGKLDDEYGNGINFKLRREFFNKETYAIDFEFGLNFTHFDIDQSNQAMLTNYGYDISPNPWPDTASTGIPDDVDHHSDGNPPAVINLGVPTNGWSAISHYDIEYAVVGLDLGVSFRTISDSNLNLFVSAGPTLSIVAHDMEKETIFDYGTSTSVVDSRSGDGIDLIVGLYLEAGLDFTITEKWSMSIAVRYDEAFNKIENEVAEIDLSGGSVILSVGYNF